MSSFDALLNLLHKTSILQATLATIILLLFTYYAYWQYRGVPPGPTGLPLLGYWPFIQADGMHLQLKELKDKYGEIFSFTSTGTLYINLCSMKLIREAHISKSDCFTDRNPYFSLLSLSFGDGVSMANGESWRVQRKFYQQKFKEYGMLAIKEDFSGPIYDNLKEMVDEIRAMDSKPFAITELLTSKCGVIIRRILFNDQGITVDELKELNQEYVNVIGFQTIKNLLLTGNVARYIVFPLMPHYRTMLRSHYRTQDILKNIIKHHNDNFDETQVTDIIDCFIKERKDRQSKGDPTAKYFSDQTLLPSLSQFVTDGVLTIAFYIGLFLETLAQYPDVQDKMYEELLDVVGPDRQPTMDDKSKLPYTNAFFYEVTRHNEIFSAVPSLMCTKETVIQGYRILKGSMTFLNIWCANHDPEIYEEPYVFNPSRFIAVPGKRKPELPISLFGIGKRACMGEPFTMIETFLFVTTIVKNFRLKIHETTSSTIQTAGQLNIIAEPRTQVENGKVK